jgi:adenosylcobyric acid synthase
LRDIDEHTHGGNLRLAAERSGLPPSRIVDFSANLNPLGPPPWLGEAVAAGLSAAGSYPDPDSLRARQAAAKRFGLSPEHFLFADGADSLAFALPRAIRASTVLSFTPSYSGYARAARRSCARFVPVPLDEAADFALDARALDAAIASCDSGGIRLAFIGEPNNPVGGSLGQAILLDLVSAHPSAIFAIDESFLELSVSRLGYESAIGKLPDNCLVIRSLTKTFAMPGIRAGWASGEPGLLKRIRAELQAWPLSSVAEEAAVMALADEEWGASGARFIASALVAFEGDLRRRFAGLDGIKLYPAVANFLLARLPDGRSAHRVAEALLSEGILVRTFSEAEGLGDSWLRFAVRRPEENARLGDALERVLASESL